MTDSVADLIIYIRSLIRSSNRSSNRSLKSVTKEIVTNFKGAKTKAVYKIRKHIGETKAPKKE
ncbi:unnamed protein product [Sphenostylis stenocarpa]|uniref:Uncharacterized protein n=1 Tax=Sphenostylis stenocarpa TaxID=92480 RepID=A0AA86VP12_9FABA|nr:unnamed protein product [Sphenostylis stenocarpa]